MLELTKNVNREALMSKWLRQLVPDCPAWTDVWMPLATCCSKGIPPSRLLAVPIFPNLEACKELAIYQDACKHGSVGSLAAFIYQASAAAALLGMTKAEDLLPELTKQLGCKAQCRAN